MAVDVKRQGKLLSRIDGFFREGAKGSDDDSVYFDGHMLVADIRGDAAEDRPLVLIRRIAPDNSAVDLFRFDADGDIEVNGTPIGGMTNPMTTTGDIIVGGASGTPTRLAVGAAGTVLIGGTSPAWSAAPTVTSLDAASYIVIGSNPAQAGAIRLANNGGIFGRNAANNADRHLIRLSTSDEVELDASGVGVTMSTLLKIGTNPATTGILRIPNNTDIYARNAANSGNVHMMAIGSDDLLSLFGGNVKIGSAFLQVGTTPATAGAIRIPNGNTLAWRNAANSANYLIYLNSSDKFIIENGVQLQGTNFLEFGTTAANAGQVRLQNAATIVFRNAANNANVQFVTVNSSNQIVIGAGDGWNGVLSVPNLINMTLGTNPATAGIIGLPNNQQIKARNAANTSNIRLIDTDASDNVNIGESTMGTGVYVYDKPNTNSLQLLRTRDADATGHLPANQRTWTI